MLEEIKKIKQRENNKHKRWFRNKYFDLILWQDNSDKITQFQLCYNIYGDEHVLIWEELSGTTHKKIDSGEDFPHKNMSPVIVTDGEFNREFIIKKFIENSKKIDDRIRLFIIEKIKQYKGEKENV